MAHPSPASPPRSGTPADGAVGAFSDDPPWLVVPEELVWAPAADGTLVPLGPKAARLRSL